MSRVMLRLLCSSLSVLAFAATLPATAQAHWAVSGRMQIGGDGGWDYVTVDAATHRIFVTRSTHTQVIDEASGRVVGDIPGQIRAHGVALVPALHRGFITDGGGEGAILVFDMNTYAVLGKLKAMPDADGIIYDAATKTVLAASGDGNALITLKPDIDPVHGEIGAPIALGGSPEFLAADGRGHVFVDMNDKDVVAEVDLKSRSVDARWPVAPGGRPTGIAIDAAHHRMYVGCRKPQMLVEMSTDDGKVLGSVPIGAGVDADRFADGEAFASTGDGHLTVAADKSGKMEVVETVATAAGARTMGIDARAGKIFLPTAEFDGVGANGRPKPKPGSFAIIELTRQ